LSEYEKLNILLDYFDNNDPDKHKGGPTLKQALQTIIDNRGNASVGAILHAITIAFDAGCEFELGRLKKLCEIN
jgi:hypothetical protein